jgi:hypothetical protein
VFKNLPHEIVSFYKFLVFNEVDALWTQKCANSMFFWPKLLQILPKVVVAELLFNQPIFTGSIFIKGNFLS